MIKVGFIPGDSGQKLSPKIAAEAMSVFRSLQEMFNDDVLMSKINRQYLEGAIPSGFEWYMDPVVKPDV